MKEEFWDSPRFLTFITISLLISFSTVSLLPSVQADSNDDFSSATSLQSGVFVDGVVNQPHGTDSHDYYRVNVLTGDSIVFELFSEDYVDICIYEGTQSSDQVECYYYIDLLITHYEFTQQSTYYLEVSCLECEWGEVAGEYVVTATVYSDEAGNSINDAADLEPETMVNGSLFGTDSDYYSTPVVDGDTIQVTIDSESGHPTSYRIYDDDEVMIQEDHELGDYDFNITVVTEGNLTIELLCAFEEQCDYSLIARGTSYVPDSDGDGVDDNSDLCPGHDDNIDVDNDGIPDGCDSLLDNDGDGVANSADACEGHDDNVDIDNDGTPDGCDSLLDNDGDGVANSADACEGHDDNVDVDNDGTPDGCDSLIDNDGDGIEDASDNCPNTPSGVTTNSIGCAESNMELDLTANAETIGVGGDVELQMQVINHGPSIAMNISVYGELPAGLTLVSTSGCENDPVGLPVCNLGNIDSGEEKKVTINAIANEKLTTDLNYSIYLQSDGTTIYDSLGDETIQLNLTTNEDSTGGESDDSSGFNIMILILLTVVLLIAAIAIPKFSRYNKKTKTAEAGLNLKTLGSGPNLDTGDNNGLDRSLKPDVGISPIIEPTSSPANDISDNLEVTIANYGEDQKDVPVEVQLGPIDTFAGGSIDVQAKKAMDKIPGKVNWDNDK
ncbi:MAG: thrombospondin type 3 repeat-containing protein [Candidatus Thalassarchaeaceae archaeon]|nr:thrombospondin type 3 repeat-containing protein [Candidatus Thalassarchaeaceae archaeon]